MIEVGAVRDNAYNSDSLKFVSHISVGSLKTIANPYTSGQSFIIFSYIPKQIMQVTSGTVGDRSFFDLMESTFQEVSGINDISLETDTMTGGFAAINHNFPTSATSATESITLGFQAMHGNVYRAPIQHWLTTILDPRTNLSSIDNWDGIHSYAAEMIYINTAPNVGSKNGESRKEALEFSAIFDSMYPKSVPLSHFSYTKNSHSFTELSIEFNCEMIIGGNIDKVAGNILSQDWFYNKYILPAKKYNVNRKNNGEAKTMFGETPHDLFNEFDENDGYKYFVVDGDADLDN